MPVGMDIDLDRNLSAPVYQQITDEIRRQISTGKLYPGMKIPDARKLCKQLGVAYPTLVRSLKILKQEGLLVRVPSSGTFVKTSPNNIKNVAVIFDAADHTEKEPWMEHILSGIFGQADPSKWHLQLFPLPGAIIFGHGEQTLLSRLIRSQDINGLIVTCSPQHSPEEIEKLVKLGTPTVTLRNQYPNTGIPSVIEDVASTAKQLVDYAARDLGHSRIKLIMGSNPESSDRVLRSSSLLTEALLQEFRDRGMPCAKEPVLYSDFRWKNVAGAVRNSLTSQKRPTFIICCADMLAFETIQLAEELGLNVPRDLSVACVGDVLHDSKLTCVHVPLEEMGSKAAELLNKIILGKPVESVSFPVKLVVRQTCGPARRVNALF